MLNVKPVDTTEVNVGPGFVPVSCHAKMHRSEFAAGVSVTLVVALEFETPAVDELTVSVTCASRRAARNPNSPCEWREVA